MRTTLLQKMALILSFLLVCNLGYAVQEISFTWKGNGDNTRTITIAIAESNNGFDIDWGNGEITNAEKSTILGYTKEFTSPVYGDNGDYQVKIIGKKANILQLVAETSFKALDITGCEVSSLSVSGTKLTTLKAANNNLTSLNISEFAKVEVDIILNPKGRDPLEFLDVSNNNLTDLDASNNESLETLDITSCGISSLNVSGTILTTLKAANNNLTSLDISGLEKVEAVLGMGGRDPLELLDVSNNNITDLDISNNKSLVDVQCYDNMLSISNLYDISRITKENGKPILWGDNKSKIRYYGTQNLDEETIKLGEDIDLSECAEVGGAPTEFIVHKDGTRIYEENNDYQVSFGVFTFPTVGKYTIEMTNDIIESDENYLAKVIAPYNVSSTTSIEGDNKSFAISIYPNPVADQLYIQSAESDMSVSIFDLNGRIVLQTNYSAEGINVSSLPNGTYLLKALNKDQIFHSKFIKK